MPVAPIVRRVAPVLGPVASYLARAHISANLVTVAGFVAGLGAFAAVATHNYWWGLGLIAINRLFAGLDGAVARLAGETDLGAFLETVLNMIVMATIPLAFALADPGRALASAFLIVGLAASGFTFLAFAATAGKCGRAGPGPTSMQYPRGLVESTGAFFALALACALPDRFSVIAYVFGVLCFVTTGVLVAVAVLRFRKP